MRAMGRWPSTPGNRYGVTPRAQPDEKNNRRKMSFMTFVEVIEIAKSSAAKRAIYFRAILLLIAMELIPTAAELSGIKLYAEPRKLIDFDGFYIAGQLVWQGAIEKAYHFARCSLYRYPFLTPRISNPGPIHPNLTFWLPRSHSCHWDWLTAL